jgi:hypothetical protein
LTALDRLRAALADFNAISVKTLRATRDVELAESGSCGVLFAECRVALESVRKSLEEARDAMHAARDAMPCLVADEEPVTDRQYRARLDTLPSEGEAA